MEWVKSNIYFIILFTANILCFIKSIFDKDFNMFVCCIFGLTISTSFMTGYYKAVYFMVVLTLTLNGLTAIKYGYCKIWHMFFYWWFAFGLTYIVTFSKKG